MELALKKYREVLHFCPGCSAWRTEEKFQTKKITQGTYGHCDECVSTKPMTTPESRSRLFVVAEK